MGNSIIAKRKRCATIIPMKRLILVDDHKMLRKGIISYITENSDWQIFAEAERAEEIPGIIKEAGKAGGSITVAVVDMQLKGEKDGFNEGYNVVKMLSQGNIPSVIFSSHDSGACIDRAISAEVGAKGFVSKSSDERILLDAINAVADGKTYIQSELVAGVLENRSLRSMLTKRESQVLAYMMDGFSNEEIAAKLKIKLTTIENYISIIYDKTGSRNKVALLEKLKYN